MFDKKTRTEQEEIEVFCKRIDKRIESLKGYKEYDEFKKRGEFIKQRAWKLGN